MHCPHLFKLGAKIQACQESVSDPSDLVHALKVNANNSMCYNIKQFNFRNYQFSW